MGYIISKDSFNRLIKDLSGRYIFYGPVKMPGRGAFSDSDLVAYSQVTAFEQMDLSEKSRFSPKEIICPIDQTLFYFTEEAYVKPRASQKEIIIFCRPCDVHAFKRLDGIFLNSGGQRDNYYEELRSKVKFFVIECAQSFDSCFCVSMGTNRVEGYDALIRAEGDRIICDAGEEFNGIFSGIGEPAKMDPRFIEENKVRVAVPENIDKTILNHPMWEEYSTRCIACGRCTVSCPTCSCFTMQDIFYEDNVKCGERRRVWASCMIDGFSDMAGGHSFRKTYGERMRYKVMHKIYDFGKRFGYNMCVGCGRCDDVCPEYISFSRCINKVSALAEEGEKK